jgi:hypothetical protein
MLAANEIRRGLPVHTEKELRRLGKQIPVGTHGTVSGSYTPPGLSSEIIVKTELGCFVVSSGDISIGYT